MCFSLYLPVLLRLLLRHEDGVCGPPRLEGTRLLEVLALEEELEKLAIPSIHAICILFIFKTPSLFPILPSCPQWSR